MAKKMCLLLGTRKGAFILESDTDRRDWELRGPFCDTWPMNHVVADRETGTIYAGGGNEWFGPAVWKSEDLGASWSHSSEGLAYAPGEEPIKAVWSLGAADGALYVGVQPAGLFRSTDGGRTWAHLGGLQEHPSRPHWNPGGAGLILHSLVSHPEDPDQLWVGISAAGVFHTADGGRTWEPRNHGTRADFLPEGQNYPDYLLPLNGDIEGRYVPDGKTAVWRTRDGGQSWEDQRAGLPQKNAFFNVLRQAMATDELEPAGVYFGTNNGALFASPDEGDSWNCIAEHLPSILSVETLVVDR